MGEMTVHIVIYSHDSGILFGVLFHTDWWNCCPIEVLGAFYLRPRQREVFRARGWACMDTRYDEIVYDGSVTSTTYCTLRYNEMPLFLRIDILLRKTL